MELLGIADRCRPTAETHIILDEYYFSAPVSMIVCWSPYAVDFLRERFLPLATASRPLPRRFYIRRVGVARTAANEPEIEAYFSKLGWGIVDTAQLDFQEQIAIFSQAEAICAVHGAGLANLVWCPSSCKVIEIFAAGFLSGCYEWICIQLGIQYVFLVAPQDSSLRAVVDLAELRRVARSLRLE